MLVTHKDCSTVEPPKPLFMLFMLFMLFTHKDRLTLFIALCQDGADRRSEFRRYNVS